MRQSAAAAGATKKMDLSRGVPAVTFLIVIPRAVERAEGGGEKDRSKGGEVSYSDGKMASAVDGNRMPPEERGLTFSGTQSVFSVEHSPQKAKLCLATEGFKNS